MNIARSAARDRGPLVAGVLLILLGAGFLVAQALNVDVGHYGWPFFVIVPGLAILIVGLMLPPAPGVGLAILGAMTTMTGLVLLYQNSTDDWESWAYAWALVAPGSVGLGLLLEGLVRGRRDLVEDGTRVASVGLALFLVFGILFEDVIGIGGDAPSVIRDALLPGGLIVLGVAIVLRAVLRGRERPA